MDAKIKFIIVGDVRGKFKQLFQRIESINKKAGPFECLFCVGHFFGPEGENDELIAYKNGNKNVPVPTYILGPNDEESVNSYKDIQDGELCTNLTYLGKRGLYNLSSGVKVAYLSGVEASSGATKSEYNFDKEDVVSLRNSCIVGSSCPQDYRGVDILLTSQWPYGMDSENKNASKLISFLCKEVKPRYHFCGLNGKYYESPPYRCTPDQTTQLALSTRFIGMADIGNAQKAKYLYALSLLPVGKMRLMDILQKTIDEVPCPYVGIDFADCKVQKESSDKQQFFYDMQSRHDGQNNRKRGGGDAGGGKNRRPRIQNIDQDKCWFCLSSPDVEKHLVISIGENFYLALAKGPINDYHVLILSITHIPSASLLTDDDWQELMKFKNALREFFKQEGQVVCFTERNYKSSHLQINALGIDAGYAWKIAHAFEDKGEEYNLQFEKLPKLTSAQMLPHQGPYFVAELPAGEEEESTLITRQMKHFPLHFARDVFCTENLLNCEEKVDWKECKLDKDAEIEMVQNFRKKFAKYDFTL